jgi:diguanylate cyclase (GGDEF)-like protein
MPPRVETILVVLEEGENPQRVLGRGRAGPPALASARWGNLPEEEIRGGRVAAILYRADGRAAGRAAGLRRLRRLARGVPLVPFVLERFHGRGAGPRRGDPAGSVVALREPLDADLVRAIVAREHLVADLRQVGRRAQAAARGHDAKLRALAAIVRATGNDLDPQRIIELAMEQVGAFLKLRAWLFLLADPEQGLLTVAQTGGEGLAEIKGTRLGIGEGIAGRAAQKRQPVIVEEVGSGGATHGAPELPKGLTARSVLAVPLLSRGRVVGVVEAIDRLAPGPLRGADARLLSLLLEPAAVAVDNALLLRRSEELSVTDDLTKLYNSRFLNAALHREVERSKRYRTPVSLIFLDLDGFKSVNDQHGHLWGSRTLVEVGAVVKGTVREIDVVSRFGGDEFTVILPQTGPEGAQIIADRIRQQIAETVFLESYGLEVRITASLGIASFPDHGRSKDDLIARADQAMYVVKGRGKDGVALAEPDSPRPLVVRTVR